MKRGLPFLMRAASARQLGAAPLIWRDFGGMSLAGAW